jgi:hypothetical protein
MNINNVSRVTNEMFKLPSNWNSYGADPIAPSIVDAGLTTLDALNTPDLPDPDGVVPTVRRGFQVEWHQNGIDAEVEFSDHTVSLSFEAAPDQAHRVMVAVFAALAKALDDSLRGPKEGKP